MGDLEGVDYDYSSRYNNHYDEEEAEGTMGEEIYEEEIKVEHWGEDDRPSLGTLNLDISDILTHKKELSTNEAPIHKEQEGYTGNAGMTMEYWYHFGAIILWKQEEQDQVLLNKPVSVRLEWLNYYADRWDTLDSPNKKKVLEIVGSLNQEIQETSYYNYSSKKSSAESFNALAKVLIKIKYAAFLKTHFDKLIKNFHKIDSTYWADLLKNYPTKLFDEVFETVGTEGDLNKLEHLLKTLQTFEQSNDKHFKSFLKKQIQHLPNYLNHTALPKKPQAYEYSSITSAHQNTTTHILEMMLEFSESQKKKWTQETFEALTKKLPRPYVNEMLVPIVLKPRNTQTKLVEKLYKCCVQELKDRTAEKPQPLPDWERPIPQGDSYDKSVWKILTPFLQSKTKEYFDYQAVLKVRKNMMSVVNYATVDLRMETIKQGSPHTLRLIKTHEAYHKDLKRWEEDVKLLQHVEETGL